ncbi:MAG: DUF1080 domain-containing protein [Thermoflexibacter sp.]|nr:DUF1080 domain-containing protein [Thermoflexibacter sp.]
MKTKILLMNMLSKKMFFFIFLIALLFAYSSTFAQSKKGEALFRPDLSNAVYEKGVWSFDNGILTATEDKHIWTTTEYENFVLELEFKTDTAANSGVFVYGSKVEGSAWLTNSFEIQIADDYAEKIKPWADNWKCGALFGLQAPSIKNVVKKAGKWNKLKIICKGQSIQVFLNKKLINDINLKNWTSTTTNPDGTKMPEWLVDSTPKSQKPTKGKIGFQGRHAGAAIFFRNMTVRSLD